MESNQNGTDNLKEIVIRNEKFFSTDNLNYLYPHGHHVTHQMSWFKAPGDKRLSSNLVA